MLARAVSTLLVAVLAAPTVARAFTIESPIGDGCHEQISTVAVARTPFGADVPTWPADDTHRRLVGSVPFTAPPEARYDPRVLALLIGVRAPDTDGIAVTDLDRLGTVHGNPTTQMQHCLRSPSDDFGAGDASALAACRAEILAELDAALGPGDTVDAGTEDVRLSLAFEGTQTVTLPRFPYRVGRALHALQDSFPHAYRDASGRIVSVHNWVDWVGDDFDATRDGVRHQSDRDHCEGSARVLARVMQAEDASIDLLGALADTTGGRAGRLARAGAVLDHWLALLPGCDATNAFCGAPDAVTTEGSCAAAPGTPSRGAVLALLALGLVAALALRRRRAAGALVFAACLVVSGAARAQEHVPETPPRERAPETVRERGPGWGASLTAAASLESPSLAFGAGARFFPHPDWRIGLDVEWSPWLSVAALRGAPGAASAYASVQWDWARVPGVVRVGTRIALGVSVLLFDEYGASTGDVGPYVAATLIGAGFDVAPGWELRLDPEASVAVPHVVGVPLVYREYRLAMSVVWRP